MKVNDLIEIVNGLEEGVKELKERLQEWKKQEKIREAKLIDKNMTDEQVEMLRKYIHALFKLNSNRYLIEESLRGSGFRKWASIEDKFGKPNPDEEVWVYDPDNKVPNGQIIVLINWTWGFYWVYVKVDRGEF